MKAKIGHCVKVACVRVGGTGLGLSAKGGAEGLPSRMKILNWGENPNSRGMRVHVGEKFLAALRAPLYPWRKVALDFEHNTMPGSAAYRESKEPRDVAGFCAVECVPGDGVYIVMEEWTDAGRAKAQMYADLSAAPALDAAGEVVGIQSVALCKCGAVEGMDFVEARVALSAEAARFFDNSNTKDSKMDWKKIIASLLGLNAEAATDEDIKGAAQRVLGLNADSATAEDVRGALRRLLGVDGATNVDGVGGNVAGLSAQIEAAVKAAVLPLNAELQALKGDLVTSRKDAIVQSAVDQGKVVGLAADVVAGMTPEQLQKHVDGLPVTVPLSARTPGHVDEGSGGGAITDQQRRIAEGCGLDPEKVFGGAKKN